MKSLILATAILAALVGYNPAFAQGACPPEEAKPRELVEKLLTNSAYVPILEQAQLADFDVEDIRPLTPDQDGPACGALNAWAHSYQDKVRHPRGRWTFYGAGPRYILVYWIGPPPPGQDPGVFHGRSYTAWIFDEDSELLASAPL